MKSAVFASALAVAGAEKVNLSFKDCGSGSTHAKINALKPDSIDVPGQATIVGSGALDADQTSASFSLKVKKGFIPFVSGKGSICEDTTINLPLGVGSFTVKGLDCPIKAGDVDVEVELNLLSDVFEDGENSLLSIHIDANADDTGDQVICLDVDASLGAVDAVNGACTSDEQAALADPKVVGDKANDCGTKAYNFITGKFDHDNFNSCFTSSIGISATCSECYAATGEYGAKNCKADCLLGWCKSGCLSCTAPAQETLATCTGFTAATADPCEEELKAEAAVTGTLAVTYSDCGAKHGVVTGLSPLSISTGSTATVTGTGTVDEVVTSGHFTATVSALGTKLTECSGDGTSDIVCNFPLNVGSITLKALPFPLQKGSITIPVEVTTSKLIPTSLANVDLHVAAEDQNGESAICLDVHVAASVHATAGACTSDEQAALADPKVVGDKANDCGTKAYNFITGKFDHDNFNSCFTSSIGISATCSECYAATGEYGAKNCKADCILGWCKSGCLSCTAPAQETLATCTGFTAATADPCEEKAQGFLATVTV